MLLATTSMGQNTRFYCYKKRKKERKIQLQNLLEFSFPRDSRIQQLYSMVMLVVTGTSNGIITLISMVKREWIKIKANPQDEGQANPNGKNSKIKPGRRY